MHTPNTLPKRIVRALGLAVPALALLVTGCNRDELAPDCFEIDPDTGVCLIPDPGGVAVGINCQDFPPGALRAEYSFTPEVGGGSGNYDNWMAMGLPPGLTIDPVTGEISGIPEQQGEFQNITISVTDIGKGRTESAECGPLEIRDHLNAFRVRTEEPYHCIPHTASFDEMLAYLDGGDDTDISCSLSMGNGASCPIGDGKGRMAPGVTFDESNCTHSGTITGTRRGTWVWAINIEQSGFTTTVPFCATNDVDTYHDLVLTANGINNEDTLKPGLLEFDPTQDVEFGSGSYHWDINDPNCPGNDCNNFGFRFDVTCSPFDPGPAPYQITLSPSGGSDTGLFHEITASGPAPGEDSIFATRPFIASFETSYCTSADGNFCNVDDAAAFESNAQTKYHFDVVGYPVQ